MFQELRLTDAGRRLVFVRLKVFLASMLRPVDIDRFLAEVTEGILDMEGISEVPKLPGTLNGLATTKWGMNVHHGNICACLCACLETPTQ